MTTPDTLLEIVPAKYNDETWLYTNLDDIYDVVAANLKSADYSISAIRDLLYVLPYLLDKEELRRWARLMREAHKHFRIQLKQDKLKLPFQIYHLTQRPKQFRPTKRRRRERIDARELLEIYLILLMSRIYQDPQEITPDQINDILAFARTINDPHLYHKVYQTLAFIYNERYDYQRALDYARMAYEYWAGQDFFEEIVRFELAMSAYAMASAYVGLKNPELADNWMNRAAELFAKTDAEVQYGLVSYQYASIKTWVREYDAAAQWFEFARDNFIKLEAKYHEAITIGGMAMAQAFGGHYDEARQYVLQSIDMLGEFKNPQRVLGAEHTLAFIEAKSGNLDEARAILERHLEELEAFEDNDWKETHMLLAKMLLQGIVEGRLDELNHPGDTL